MARVVLDKLTKVFEKSAGGEVRAVDGVSLVVEDREFMTLVGPSGCGKTTTLRLIAGLEEPSGGTVKIGDKIVNQMPPKDRNVAMVFQNYALFPHMSARENMAFGLKLRKFPKAEIEKRVGDAAEILGLNGCLKRKPQDLSGGERQRVAIGRAIVRRPEVFLFDEPLSNLDAPLRAQLRNEIAKLHHQIGATMIYVTHDQSEAMTLGERVAVMQSGRIEQVGTPEEVYRRPVNSFVAGFIGSLPMNLCG